MASDQGWFNGWAVAASVGHVAAEQPKWSCWLLVVLEGFGVASTHPHEPTTRNGGPADSGLEEVTCRRPPVLPCSRAPVLHAACCGRWCCRGSARTAGRPPSVCFVLGRACLPSHARVEQSAQTGSIAISAAPVGGFWQQSHGEDHGPGNTGVAVSSPEAAKNNGRLKVFYASPLPLCIVSISRGLQATPVLPCNTQPYVHTAALPAPLAAKQPLCLPLCPSAPRHDEPPTPTCPARRPPPSADAIVGPIEELHGQQRRGLVRDNWLRMKLTA
ncbi:hypothetical protein P171DRAFT_517069 [Karstenula rhodostoma CBS 690.94]|uniref:Uncharacterized protein n=1 Tax=Karstenula rhodostoma CBS 690.94 TaxID=1392251 RepID=A0A9P4PQB1_9PLEO|nr:hypothetical protein P171DRAFT_517069 [Karstenula rhodostoma CBS 690.94]